MNMSYGPACGWEQKGLAQQDKSIKPINDFCWRVRVGNTRIKDQRSVLIFTVLFASISHRF